MAYKSNYTLTKFDHENWWNFLMEKYPKNYFCARWYYSGKKDPDLAIINCVPQNFDINDYFKICQLPNITAKNGIIKVNNRVVKRYDGFEEWKRKRLEFDELKQSALFKKWKNRQYYYCQNKRCSHYLYV